MDLLGYGLPVESTNSTRSFQWNPPPLLDPSPAPHFKRHLPRPPTPPTELPAEVRSHRVIAYGGTKHERTVEDDETGLASEVVTK
uniref:Uncharacterized protein n=1 Tax=Oryza barthii TaxID=65489 RepID=A0A0D3GF63_9ORYZ